MSKNLRLFSLFSILGLVISCYFIIPQKTEGDISNSDKSGALDLGSEELVDITDKSLRPMVVLFWAVDCPYCMKVMPIAEEIHQEYGGKGLRVIGVVPKKDRIKEAKKLIKSKGITFQNLYDKDERISKLLKNDGLIPHTIIINKSGKIILNKFGTYKLIDIKEKLESVLE